MRRPNYRSNRGTSILIFWSRVSIHLLFSPTFHCTQRNMGWFLGNCHTEWPSETGFAGLRDKLAIMSNSPYSERPAACTLQKTLKTKTEIHINVEGWGWWKLRVKVEGVKEVERCWCCDEGGDWFFCVCCKLMVLRVHGVDDCIGNKQMTSKYSLYLSRRQMLPGSHPCTWHRSDIFHAP